MQYPFHLPPRMRTIYSESPQSGLVHVVLLLNVSQRNAFALRRRKRGIKAWHYWLEMKLTIEPR